MRDKLGRFVKGYPTWNKNKKTGLIPKSAFKKGNIPWNKDKKGLQHPSEETKQKIGQAEQGEKNSNWKGGRFKDAGGYILLKSRNHPFADNQGYVREHRLVVEKQIGRYLTPEEVSHHRGAKDDNRPHRLMAFVNNSAHQRFEKGSNVKSSEIVFDGRKL